MTPEIQTQIKEFFVTNRAELVYPNVPPFTGTPEELMALAVAAKTIEEKYNVLIHAANIPGDFKTMTTILNKKPNITLEVANWVSEFRRNSELIIEKFIKDNNIQLSLEEIQEEIAHLSKESPVRFDVIRY